MAGTRLDARAIGGAVGVPGEHREAAAIADPARVFERHRPRLRALAYRMLGALGDAEEVVQDAYLRWHDADVGAIVSPEAWLVTATTRLAIDRLRARAAERRAYVGPWLPEPWLGDPGDGREPAGGPAPDRRLERIADLSIAFLLLLERLAPEERAAFLLREVFEAGYAEIARTLGRSEAACRQIVHRARARVRAGRARFTAGPDQQRRMLDRFLQAIEAADQNGLLALLAPDATLASDGGGKVAAARNLIRGADRVARFLLGVARKWPGLTTEIRLINGVPGALRWRSGRVDSTLSVDADDAGIRAVYIVLNPDKLTHVD